MLSIAISNFLFIASGIIRWPRGPRLAYAKFVNRIASEIFLCQNLARKQRSDCARQNEGLIVKKIMPRFSLLNNEIVKAVDLLLIPKMNT